jgi:hypothetical protein
MRATVKVRPIQSNLRLILKEKEFSRSVVDAIDYQLDLLGYITETM